MSDRQLLVHALFDESVRLHQVAQRTLTEGIVRAADLIGQALHGGGKVLVFGNGGSAADAQHFAAELVGRFERDRRPLAALALTTDTSILTSVANDEGFERIFVRQIEAMGAPGDVAFGITTSGRSPNVVRALRAAHERGLKTVALTGSDGGEAGGEVDLHLNVAGQSTARVQEVHITVLHAICAVIESGM
jgi:D-sedoheptulose 7-phosphate isomerase